MADYKAIKGWTIQTVSSDPSNPIAGQVWYNSTLGKIKAAGASGWATGGNLNTARSAGIGAGTQTAALKYGGEAGSPTSVSATTEFWNGSAWTEVNDLNDSRTQISGGGEVYTSVIAAAGNSPPRTANTETFDGTSWTEVNNLNTVREGGNMMAANATAATFAGGRAHPSYYTQTEDWDGTSWTEVAELSTAVYNGSSAGTKTSGWVAGGIASAPTQPAATQEWEAPSAVQVKTVTIS